MLSLGGLAVGILTASAGCIYVLLSSLPNTDAYFGAVATVSFIVGMLEFSILSKVIDSGVSTTFVCLALDPQAIRIRQPDLYQSVVDAYPQVLFI